MGFIVLLMNNYTLGIEIDGKSRIFNTDALTRAEHYANTLNTNKVAPNGFHYVVQMMSFG